MLKHATLCVAAISCLTLGTSALAQDANTVVAKVGETEITLGEMIIARARLPQQYDQFPDSVLFEGVLDQLIQQQLFADSVAEQPLRVTMALNNERRQLMAGEAINSLTNDVVTEDALQDAYDARYEGVEPGTEYNASHLLVDTEEEALAAKARIDDGEDFADVARAVSTGPTGPNGGNLGWFGTGAMVPEFEATVVALEPGEISEPVKTQFGWHVVTLNETRPVQQPDLETLRGELTSEIQEAAVTNALEKLRAEAAIEMPEEDAFDASLINSLDLLEPETE